MEQQNVNYSWICENEAPRLKELKNALSLLGIQLTAIDQEDSSCPTVIFFDRASQKLFDILNLSNGRILTVALSHEAIHGSQTWHLLNAGASDVFLWSSPSELAAMIGGRLNRWQIIDGLVDSPIVTDNLVGKSHSWISVMRQVVEVAYFTPSTVLINGDSGTGKELVARLIHTLDRRPDKQDLIILDCSTIVPELSGSEFFGHERGAFTNALSGRDGAFAQADKGTLFLDEVGELTPTLQAGLLRVVQEKSYKRVGGNQWKKTDFRLICATNKDLMEAQKRGSFRSDFYYRIAAFRCHLPRLEDRRQDILPLAMHFWKQFFPETPVPDFDPIVRDYLLTRDYPGNVRELEQLIQRMCSRYGDSGPVTAGLLMQDDRPKASRNPSQWRDEAFKRAVRMALSMGVGLKEIGRDAEETAERIAIMNEDGNVQRAARKLGITDRALQMRQAKRRLKSA